MKHVKNQGLMTLKNKKRKIYLDDTRIRGVIGFEIKNPPYEGENLMNMAEIKIVMNAVIKTVNQ